MAISYFYHPQGSVVCENTKGLVFFLQGQRLSRSSLVPSTLVQEPPTPPPVAAAP